MINRDVAHLKRRVVPRASRRPPAERGNEGNDLKSPVGRFIDLH